MEFLATIGLFTIFFAFGYGIVKLGEIRTLKKFAKKISPKDKKLKEEFYKKFEVVDSYKRNNDKRDDGYCANIKFFKNNISIPVNIYRSFNSVSIFPSGARSKNIERDEKIFESFTEQELEWIKELFCSVLNEIDEKNKIIERKEIDDIRNEFL